MINSLLLMSSVLLSSAALSAELKNDTKITFDLQGKQIQFYGVYAPGSSGSRAQGLDAEIAARRNGIIHLNTFLVSQCAGKSTDQSSEKTSSPAWQGVVKSQGSEIFANGVLKISLVAPMKEVFKDTVKKKALRLKTSDGVPLALRFPKVPARALKCGLVSLNIGGRTVEVNPLSVSSESGAKVVNLSVDGFQLKPSGAAELALLENSNLVKTSDVSASDSNSPSSQKATDEASAKPEAVPAGQSEGARQAN
jgi:hypothetical protein